MTGSPRRHCATAHPIFPGIRCDRATHGDGVAHRYKQVYWSTYQDKPAPPWVTIKMPLDTTLDDLFPGQSTDEVTWRGEHHLATSSTYRGLAAEILDILDSTSADAADQRSDLVAEARTWSHLSVSAAISELVAAINATAFKPRNNEVTPTPETDGPSPHQEESD